MQIKINDLTMLMDSKPFENDFDVSIVTVNALKIIKDGVFILRSKTLDDKAIEQCNQAIEKGAVAIISEMQIKDYPCIITQDCMVAYSIISRFYRDKIDTKIVAVTGSTGKTTAKDMIHLTVSDNLDGCIKTGGSSNSPAVTSLTVLSLKPKDKVAVLEMGMSCKGVISKSSFASRPDIAVITNIGYSHIAFFNSQEDILKAKLEILDGMTPDGKLILNIDDPLLATVKDIEQTIITVSIDNSEADYYAESIEQTNEYIEFIVVSNGEKTKVRLNCLGIHNIYNALFAFAVSDCFDIEKSKVAVSLEKYRTSGVRQNILTYQSNKVIADCFNAAPDSMCAAFDMLANITPTGKGRRIAVLADMLELGQHSIDLHCQVGQKLSNYPIDMVYCYGKYSSYIADSINNPSTGRICIEDRDILINILKQNIYENDVILFKGSHSMALDSIMNEVFENKSNESLYRQPVKTYLKAEDIKIFAKSGMLVDLSSGSVIGEKNKALRQNPVAITNILTTVIALEQGCLDDIVQVKSSALTKNVTTYGSSKLGLCDGEQYKMKDLLYGFMITGGNDAANVIAEHVGGSIVGFSRIMNSYAEKYNCTDSNFVYPHGLYNKNHYSSAEDLLKIFFVALRSSVFRDMLTTREYTISPINSEGEDKIISTNNLTVCPDSRYYDSRIIGGKGGNVINESGYASVAQVSGKTLACVVLGSERIDGAATSYADTKKLYDFGFKI